MIKRLKKMIPLMLGIAMVGTMFTGCGKSSAAGQDGEQVELNFWTLSLKPKFDPYFENLIAEYEKENPNVKINWSDMPMDVMQQKLLTSIASDQAPDVVNLNTEYALQMAGKDALVNFDEELSADEKKLYFDGLYKAASDSKGVYGLPWYTGAPVLFMNKEIIEAAGLDPNNPPKTNEEYFAWAKVIKDKTGKYGMCSGADASEFMGEGIAILNDDKTQAAFNTKEAVEYLNTKRGYFESGIIPKEKNNFDKEVQYFAAETTAMIVSGTTFLNRIKTAAPDVYEKIVVVPAPTGKAKVTFSGTMNIAVPKASKQKTEAIKFAKYLTNAKNQTQFAKDANTLPSTADSMSDPYFKEDDGTIEAKAKLESLKTLETVTDFSIGVARASDVRTEINKAIENVYLSGANPATELEKAEKRVNEILKELK